MNTKKTESGQVLFLLVIGMVSLIGFTALAIDGGRLYSERRTAQGVADTSSFTGALYIGRSSDITQTVKDNAVLAALQRAEDNGYDNADPNVTVTASAEQVGYYYLVTTEITSEIDPTFIQLVYSGPLIVTAKAVARVLPSSDSGFGQALFALNDSACDAMKFSGDADIDIYGSGILANSDCCDDAISFEGNSNTDIEDDVSTAGCVNAAGSATYSSGSTNEGVPPIPPNPVPVPDCSHLPWNPHPHHDHGTDTKTYYPGRYWGFSLRRVSRTYKFEPGLYCIIGRPGVTILNGTVEGIGVMFYLTLGRFKITGGVVDLRAAHDGSIIDGSGTVWDGMLIYMDPTNPNDVRINGNSGSYFEGTVYAPSAECQLNGNGLTESIDLSLVCDTIDIKGDAGLVIDFNEAMHYQPPTALDLVE